jgi:hypothetical protein
MRITLLTDEPYFSRTPTYHAAMGFNPFRPQRRGVLDIAMVAGTILLAVALVLWAALSG